MNPRRAVLVGAVAAITLALAWLLFFALPRWYGRPLANAAAARPTPAPSEPVRKIKARLFYVSDDGVKLLAVERDVPYGEGTTEQARQIIESQVAPVAEPLVSAIPPGTKLRALFVADRGEAYVDLSRDATSAHAGGTTTEMLTVSTIVNALTTNLPAVTSVQILVDGKEVDTLAGHVDLRRPLARHDAIVQSPPRAEPAPAPAPPAPAPPQEPPKRR